MIYPRTDLFDLCTISDATFWPMHRQELSRTAGGRTQAKDIGSALWRASFTTAPARRAAAAAIEAALISLNGAAGSFLAHDVRRPFPQAYPDGAFADDLSISALYANDAFRVQLASPGAANLTAGDYFSFTYGARPSRALHMIMETKTISAGGVRAFDVFPPLRPGVGVGTPVTFLRAPCEMILEPGQQPPGLRDLAASSVSFSAVQIL